MNPPQEIPPNATWQYIGSGLGVAGLPHVVTTEEARALGLGPTLQAAIDAGNYARADMAADMPPQAPADMAADMPPQAPADMAADMPPQAGVINLADGVDHTEAALAGRTLNKRKRVNPNA